jgi:phosphonate transport system substrate-binding protein
MPRPRIVRCVRRPILWLALIALGFSLGSARAETVYYFSVLNQRSPMLTAEYWNPILAYVSKKAGVGLKLKMGRTAAETTTLTVRGEAEFTYTNHLFAPERDRLRWKVILRPDTDGIRGQIVVAAGSEVTRLEDLEGLTVAFPSREAFVGYKVPMGALTRRQIKVTPVFSGNQEGAMAQLRVGRVSAAGVNEDVMSAFAAREKFRYRVIWSSENFNDLPIMVSPAVPRADAQAVQKAFAGMRHDPEGRRILAAGAALLKLDRPIGFLVADDRDYDNYRAFFRSGSGND